MVNNTVAQVQTFELRSEVHSDDLANKFRQQVLRSGEECKIVQEQTATLKQILKRRADEMQEKLSKVTQRLEQISTRRALDIEGCLSELGTFFRKMKTIEERVARAEPKVGKDDILADVRNLKKEIKKFQQEVSRERGSEQKP